MIGITRFSNGRMGNRLFHYHFLRQITEKTKLEYFNVSFPESTYFENMNRKFNPLILLRKNIKISSKDILSKSSEEFMVYITEENKNGKNILIEPPILGEVFFDYLFYDPNQFIKVKNIFKTNINNNKENDKIIGIHFRGTDFESWNKIASLSFNYYKSAIEFCVSHFIKNNITFGLFTDDDYFEPYIKTIRLLKSIKKCNFFIGNNKIAPIYDFCLLNQCDILISSPSTFAIFAALIGKKKKIIHSKDWINYATLNNDIFWMKLVNNPVNDFYYLWKLF